MPELGQTIVTIINLGLLPAAVLLLRALHSIDHRLTVLEITNGIRCRQSKGTP